MLRTRYSLLIGWLLSLFAPIDAQCAPPEKPLKVSEEAAKRAAATIPTKITGTYQGGELVELRVRDRIAYLVKPTGKVDPQRRWVWICPFWLGINNGFGVLEHRFY